ncbi:hypothetical protein [Streptomyces niveus]|uniref:hypothetical protein n=1 Tax=Streptomyces niveus TaxID=193462 RepID=UPI0036D2D79F
MRRTVALVLDGRHAPASTPDLVVLIATFTQYLGYLVDVLTPTRATLLSGATPVADLVRRASNLLAEERLPAHRWRDVVRLADAVQDLMTVVETVLPNVGGPAGGSSPAACASGSTHRR